MRTATILIALCLVTACNPQPEPENTDYLCKNLDPYKDPSLTAHTCSVELVETITAYFEDEVPVMYQDLSLRVRWAMILGYGLDPKDPALKLSTEKQRSLLSQLEESGEALIIPSLKDYSDQELDRMRDFEREISNIERSLLKALSRNPKHATRQGTLVVFLRLLAILHGRAADELLINYEKLVRLSIESGDRAERAVDLVERAVELF